MSQRAMTHFYVGKDKNPSRIVSHQPEVIFFVVVGRAGFEGGCKQKAKKTYFFKNVFLHSSFSLV